MSRYGRTRRYEIASVEVSDLQGYSLRRKSVRQPRMFFISAVLSHHVDKETGLRTVGVLRPGKTYRRKKSVLESHLDTLSGRQRRKVRKYLASLNRTEREAA